ncbi:methionyl-tRNA formyltransferase [Methylophaga lonarensis MPL]|uniref:Methionyl-tRNA formyltransferase n=1 Tax=Methylophaga lonarensis MPL TaxID=1286106 RepID=M7P3Y1_9GAMM|nr:methionyl-tRNA formyltransferase [Methylophaga lonarensis]EMR14216.1 methionyl-tRNA formyltransferase [Methylophaga lonarensis MPL]
MRIIFAGTPEFAASSLQALLDTEHEICAVYTQPDRPAGRGRKLTPSPVKQLALQHQITVEQPENFKNEQDRQRLEHYQADVMIVVAYGLLLPQRILDAPKHGCINVHASLLPRWRGAAPIQRAILAGDKETGVCIMQMEAGLDTGPVLAEVRCAIADTETAASLHDRLAELGANTLVEALTDLPARQRNAQVQDDANTTYASKLDKSEALIDWQKSAAEIDRQIRAFNPWPVSFTQWKEQPLRIWQASLVTGNSQSSAGTVLSVTKQGIDVATGNGIIRLQLLQAPGKKAMSVADFINANRIEVGETLG